ncbi:thioesterase [Micromonospora sp. CPCC 206061]|uniref:thioesterase n=1 Tax=Micromonospora sp. CPCC 206061 TaxID=3122410 RepID=UPI002FEE71EF
MTRDAAVLRCRPRYEGANIRTWVGFKHFMYLVEEAVLHWFRSRGYGPQRLYHEHGLGLEIVDESVQLPAVLEVDDEVEAEVDRVADRLFAVRLRVERDGQPVTVLRGKVAVALIPERTAGVPPAPPPELAALVTTARVPPGLDASVDGVGAPSPGAFRWSWPASYVLCHFSDRVQHSGYVRALEVTVDRFLASVGISVGRMLAERSWIPVVSRARVRMLAPARMEETVHTTFAVDDMVRDMMFGGRMTCHVERRGAWVPVATASILHAYAVSAGPAAGSLATLDDGVIAALTGTRAVAPVGVGVSA